MSDEPSSPGRDEPDPFALAFRHLSRRERTVTEMRDHLLGRGVDVTTVEEVVEQLADDGYLDDARYARFFTEDKRALEDWGNQRISEALLARGIDRDLVAETLGGSGDHKGELERALVLLRRRFTGPPRDRRERERALGVLLRKGYDTELALDALSAYARESRHRDRAA